MMLKRFLEIRTDLITMATEAGRTFTVDVSINFANKVTKYL